MTKNLLKRPLAFLILERKLEINYGTSFLEIAEIQKEEIFKVNDEEFQVRYECWFWLTAVGIGVVKLTNQKS